MWGCGRTSTVFGMPGGKVRRPDVIEEDERPDHPAPFLERQHPPDFESAEIAAALIDHQFEASGSHLR